MQDRSICKQLGVYLRRSCRRLPTSCCSQLSRTAAHNKADCWRPVEESCISASMIALNKQVNQKPFRGQYIPYYGSLPEASNVRDQAIQAIAARREHIYLENTAPLRPIASPPVPGCFTQRCLTQLLTINSSSSWLPRCALPSPLN